MRDEKKTKGRKTKVSKASDKLEAVVPENDPVLDDGVGSAFEQDESRSYQFEQQPPAADLASLGTLPDDGPEEIPGFLRRCATETSAQDGSYSRNSRRAPNDRMTRARAIAAPENPVRDRSGEPGRDSYESRARHNRGKIPTGARLRHETDQIEDGPDFDSPDWSNSARSALSELLTDINDEQARRISNRDKFAALAGMRRSTWPLTALIVSFLLVVLAYSARNIDASATPGLIWRQAWALVVSPQENANTAPAPLVSEGEPPAPLAPREARVAAPQIAEVQPSVEKKATGLVFEPVKIVGPLGPVNPVGRQVANVKAAPAIPAASDSAGLRQNQGAQVSIKATPPAAAPGKPATKVTSVPSGTVALAPSKPASPDKMPLASLAISAAEAAPSAQELPRNLRRVASVSPDLIGVRTNAQVDVLSAPVPSIAPDFNIAAVAPQPSSANAPSLQPQPATAAGLDNKATKAMLTRAESLLEARDVASARLLFEHAASYGSAEGAFGAAKTYDPVWFEKLGVYGVPAEPEKAAAFYQIAIDAGHVEAGEYLNNLNALRRKMKLQASTALQ